MTIRLYFDEDSLRYALVNALRARGIDVQTALEVEMIERSDEEHLEFATAQGRVLCSFNVGDFYRLHTSYMTQHKSHPGIIPCPSTAVRRGRAHAPSIKANGSPHGRGHEEPGGVSQYVG